MEDLMFDQIIFCIFRFLLHKKCSKLLTTFIKYIFLYVKIFIILFGFCFCFS